MPTTGFIVVTVASTALIVLCALLFHRRNPRESEEQEIWPDDDGAGSQNWTVQDATSVALYLAGMCVDVLGLTALVLAPLAPARGSALATLVAVASKALGVSESSAATTTVMWIAVACGLLALVLGLPFLGTLCLDYPSKRRAPTAMTAMFWDVLSLPVMYQLLSVFTCVQRDDTVWVLADANSVLCWSARLRPRGLGLLRSSEFAWRGRHCAAGGHMVLTTFAGVVLPCYYAIVTYFSSGSLPLEVTSALAAGTMPCKLLCVVGSAWFGAAAASEAWGTVIIVCLANAALLLCNAPMLRGSPTVRCVAQPTADLWLSCAGLGRAALVVWVCVCAGVSLLVDEHGGDRASAVFVLCGGVLAVLMALVLRLMRGRRPRRESTRAEGIPFYGSESLPVLKAALPVESSWQEDSDTYIPPAHVPPDDAAEEKDSAPTQLDNPSERVASQTQDNTEMAAGLPLIAANDDEHPPMNAPSIAPPPPPDPHRHRRRRKAGKLKHSHGPPPPPAPLPGTPAAVARTSNPRGAGELPRGLPVVASTPAGTILPIVPVASGSESWTD